AVGEGASAGALKLARGLIGLAPVARALVEREQLQARIGGEAGAFERAEGFLGAVEEACLEEVLREGVLRALALGGREVASPEQVLVHAHGAFVFAAAAKEVAEREMQVGAARILLGRGNEDIDGLVLLFVEQQVQPLVV